MSLVCGLSQARAERTTQFLSRRLRIRNRRQTVFVVWCLSLKMRPKIYASLTQCMGPPFADLNLTDVLNLARFFSESWS